MKVKDIMRESVKIKLEGMEDLSPLLQMMLFGRTGYRIDKDGKRTQLTNEEILNLDLTNKKAT